MIALFNYFITFLDSSKRRHLLRKKVSSEKEKFRSLTDLYNEVANLIDPSHRSVKQFDASSACEIFPWENMPGIELGNSISTFSLLFNIHLYLCKKHFLFVKFVFFKVKPNNSTT